MKLFSFFPAHDPAIHFPSQEQSRRLFLCALLEARCALVNLTHIMQI